MANNDAHFSGEGHLIEAVISGDPNKTVIPVVCDDQGRLIIDLSSATIEIGKVDQGTPNTAANAWPVYETVSGTAIDPRQIRLLTASDIVSAAQSGAWSVGRTWNLASSVDSVNIGNFPATQTIAGSVSVSNFPSSQPVTEANIDKSFGTWAYYAGTSGTVVVSSGQRVLSIVAHATLASTITINGGATITLPTNTAFAVEPLGNVVAPTIIFTNTDSYFIEVVS
jgi:hypothetical protein